jgi:hypothetical protein
MALNIGKELASMRRMTVAELRGKYAERSRAKRAAAATRTT